MVTTVLMVVALVSIYKGIGAMDDARAYAIKADLLQRLALEKLQDSELLQDPSADGSNGDFSDRDYPNITWTLTENTTSVTNLDEISVTATEGKQTQTVTTQMYVQPASGTSTTGTTGATGG
jgi:hypothetical protein